LDQFGFLFEAAIFFSSRRLWNRKLILCKRTETESTLLQKLFILRFIVSVIWKKNIVRFFFHLRFVLWNRLKIYDIVSEKLKINRKIFCENVCRSWRIRARPLTCIK
jgi:hypothetical protein